MSTKCVGAWHIRPTPSEFQGRGDLQKTWAGPINSQLHGQGLTDLCNKTHENLNHLSQQMQKLDPCIEYGIKHWHPSSRPKSAKTEPTAVLSKSCRWQSVNVMFTDNKALDTMSCPDTDRDSYIDPPAKKTFCYLCSTLEEHEEHMLKHKAKKKYTGRRRIEYIAPRPKQKIKREEPEDENTLIKERLYKIEVFTSDKEKAGTNAKVYITLKGSVQYLPKTQLKKNQGCAPHCFMRASKEVFHVKGPFLGSLQILTIEHDGTKRSQAWHLDKVHITDVKVMKTWVFHCGEWLSTFYKPLYSNRVDLQGGEQEHPPTEYSIEVYTGKSKFAGTDSKIFITLYGNLGTSRKILLKDPSSDKRLFERSSVDNFKFRMNGIGEIKKIRIEHDGKGFAAGWYLEKVIITDSERVGQKYYFLYGGWIARDEGDGRLWREINAKKSLPKELNSGTKTKYIVTTKTGDVRYAGTDANVFIQMVGEKGTTNKLDIDNPENNFERNKTDNFELTAVNVGELKSIVIGHDNANPGAGWFLDRVTIRRYIPKDEALDRLRAMKRRLKKQKKEKKLKDRQRKRINTDEESQSISDSEDETRRKRKPKEKLRQKDRDEKDLSKEALEERRKKKLFTVSSSSESESSDSEDETKSLRKRSSSGRPQSAIRREGRSNRDMDDKSMYRDSRSESRNTRFRPQSASLFGRSGSRTKRDKDLSDDSSTDEDEDFSRRRAEQYISDRRASPTSADRGRRGSTTSYQSRRHISTSASALRKNQEEIEGHKGSKKGQRKNKYDDDDDSLTELKVPLYEECVFVCNQWLAQDEDDGLSVRELNVSDRKTFFKEN